MDRFFAAMGILADYPWLAAVPAVLFFAVFVASKSRILLAAAILWFLYGLYEYAMKLRILCSGECNIRIDLLLIYPALILSSTVAVLVHFMSGRGWNAPPMRSNSSTSFDRET